MTLLYTIRRACHHSRDTHRETTMKNAIALAAAALALALPAAAQSPKDLSPELQKVKAALDKYKDPVVAIHDGYFSTLGCVTYPKPGAAGQVPYAKGAMGVHFFNVALVG